MVRMCAAVLETWNMARVCCGMSKRGKDELKTVGPVELVYLKSRVRLMKGPNSRFLTFWWLALF